MYEYRKAGIVDLEAVSDLLCLLYENHERDELLEENKQLFADINQAMFIVYNKDKPVGISHGSLRREYVNGANDGLKGYLEAIYVLPEYRLKGIASMLVKMIEHWAGQHGCREMASDCLLDNTDSYKFHRKIGYAETERCIFFLKAIEQVKYEIFQVDAVLRKKLQSILEETWHSPYIATDGKLWDTRTMPGFVAISGDEILGYLMYEFHDDKNLEARICEIMVLESVAQNIGIASALIERVKKAAKAAGIEKVIVTTSNDNTHAIGFYQRRGFTLREVRVGAMEIARKLKPQIPLLGEDGIPLRDEIEFEIGIG